MLIGSLTPPARCRSIVDHHSKFIIGSNLSAAGVPKWLVCDKLCCAKTRSISKSKALQLIFNSNSPTTPDKAPPNVLNGFQSHVLWTSWALASWPLPPHCPLPKRHAGMCGTCPWQYQAATPAMKLRVKGVREHFCWGRKSCTSCKLPNCNRWKWEMGGGQEALLQSNKDHAKRSK